MNNIIRDIERHGYIVHISADENTASILKNDTVIFCNVWITDLHDYLDMLDNPGDMTLKIAEMNSGYIPIIETDFYRWLKESKKDNFHGINDAKEYLADNGFIVGKNIICSNVLSTLKIIGQHYFDVEIKPQYENINGFIFNSLGELVNTPIYYDMASLESTLYQLYGAGENIKASRIEHLKNIY